MRLSILKKTTIGFVLIALLYALMGSITYHNILLIHENERRIEELISQHISLMSIEASFYKEIVFLENYIRRADARIKDDFYRAKFNVEESLKVVADTDIHTTCNNMHRKAEEIFSSPLPIEKSRAEAMSGLMNVFLRTMGEITDKHMRENINAINEAILRGKDIRKRVLIYNLGGFGIVVIAGVLAFPYIYSTAVKPVRKLYEWAVAASKGDLSTRVQIKTGDELEELANMLNATSEGLKGHIEKLGDMVEQRTASIERAKRQWEDTFDAITDPLFIHDEEFRIIRANRAYAEIAGMSFEDMIGKPYYEIFPKRGKPFKKCGEPLESHTDEEEVFLTDISKIYKMRFYPVWDEQNRYRFSIHILEDITEARQAAEKIKREAEINRVLLEVAEVLSASLDKDEIFKRVVEILPGVIKADWYAAFLYDKELGAFVPVHIYGIPEDLNPYFVRLRLTPGMPIVDKIIKGGVAIIEDVHESPLFPRKIAETFNLRSIMAVALISKQKVIGMIGMGRIDKKVPFDDREKVILKGIAYQVATAFENAILFKETMEKTIDLSRRIETISAMHEIDRSILSTLDRDEILESAVMMVSRVIPCDRATVALVDKEKSGFVYAAGWGIDLQKGTLVPFDNTTATEVLKTGHPDYCHDIREIGTPLPLEESFLKAGFLSHIRVPLAVRGEVVGVLSVGAKRPAAFTSDNLSTLEKLASQIAVALENARLLADMKDLFIGTIKSLAQAIDAKSPWTKGHSDRVTEYAMQIGKEMGLQDKELEDLRIAGLLHDIGKIGTYDIILDKPGKLAGDEYKIVKKHPMKGSELLLPIKQLSHIVPWIRGHHERFDGRGYPDGRKEEEIPLQARILAVADSFDSMTSERPYRRTPGREKAIEELKKNAGTQFDPGVVEAFLKVLKNEGKN